MRITSLTIQFAGKEWGIVTSASKNKKTFRILLAMLKKEIEKTFKDV